MFSEITVKVHWVKIIFLIIFLNLFIFFNFFFFYLFFFDLLFILGLPENEKKVYEPTILMVDKKIVLMSSGQLFEKNYNLKKN